MSLIHQEMERIFQNRYIENFIPEMVGLCQQVALVKPLNTILEIGVGLGGSLRIWEQMIPPKEGMIIGVDNNADIVNRISGKVVELKSGKRGDWELEWQKDNVVKLRSDRQIYVVVGDSADPQVAEVVVEILGGRQIDFLFHDGAHYGPHAVYDYYNFQNLLRTDGLLCVADTNNMDDPQQWVQNSGCQSLWRALPPPKQATVSGHVQGMALWRKQAGFVLDPKAVVEKDGLMMCGAAKNPADYYL